MKRFVCGLLLTLSLLAPAEAIDSGATDQFVYFLALDGGSSYLTGLSSGFTVYRQRGSNSPAAMTTPTITEVDASNLPGLYKLLVDEDTTITTGKYSEEMVFRITNAGGGMLPATASTAIFDVALQDDWKEDGRLDLILDGAAGDANTAANNSANSNLLSTTVDTVTSQTVLVLTEGSNVDDAYNGQQAILTDDSNSDYPSPRNMVLDYDGSTKTVTLATSPNFTVEAGDGIRIALNPKTPLTSDKLSDDRDWVVGQEGNTTGQIVKLNAWSAGERRVSFVWDRFGLSPGTVIDTFNSATVTKVSDSSTVVTTNLRIHQDGRGVNFDIAAISSAARYQVEVSVTTSDDDTFSVRGTLLVE